MPKHKDTYIIVATHESGYVLEGMVRTMIADGYLPCGGVTITTDAHDHHYYYQSMVLKEVL